jgi:phage-related holin
MEHIKLWISDNILKLTWFWLWTIISILGSHYVLTQVTMIVLLFIVTIWDWISWMQVAQKYNLYTSKRVWDSFVKFANNFALIVIILIWEFVVTFAYWKELEWFVSIRTMSWFKYHLISWATIWGFLIKEGISLTENYEKLGNPFAWMLAQKLKIFQKTFMEEVMTKLGVWDKKLLPLKMQLMTIQNEYIENVDDPNYRACAKITTNYLVNIINDIYNLDTTIIKRDLNYLLWSTRKTVENQILVQRIPTEVAGRFMRWVDRAFALLKTSLCTLTEEDYKYKVIWLLIKVLMDWLEDIATREKYNNIPLDQKYRYDTND